MENTKKTIAEEKRIIEQRASSLKSIVGLGLSIEDCRRFVSGILNEAAELYANQFKQSEPVIAYLEQTQHQETIAELKFQLDGIKKQRQDDMSLANAAVIEIAELKKQNDELVEALKKSNTQIKYLHSKFRKETGTGRLRIMRNEILISKHTT